MNPNWRESIRQYRFPALSDEVMRTAGVQAADREFGNPLRLSNSGTCARRLAYQKINFEARRLSLPEPFEAEPLSARALLVFDLGDMVEASLKAWIKRAGSRFLPLGPPQDTVSITVGGTEIQGHPDGLYQEQDGSYSVVSIKSINTRGFDRVDRDGPAYEAVCQDTAYMAGLGIYKARFLYYNKDTSHIGDDWMVEFSPQLYTEVTDRWARVIGASVDFLPAPEHVAEPETEWVRGLKGYKLGSESGGETRDQDGKKVVDVKSNGYHRETGRKILPWQCSYCPWKRPCYGDRLRAVELESEKPVWVVDEAA